MNLLEKHNLAILLLIILISAAVRFFALGDFPAGFHRDEAYLGYNAYSILKTGKDISGNFLPIHIESFLFSPAGYAYASVPFIAFFDLSSFSVRFASAFFGLLSVIMTFFVTRELFSNKKNRVAIPLLSAFFLGIMPWNIILSRTATENSIVTFLLLVSVFLFLKWKEKFKKIYIASFYIVLSSTYLFYQAPRAFVPLFAPILLLLGNLRNELKSKVLLVVLYLLLIVVPVLSIISSQDLSTRIRTLSIFNSQEAGLVVNEQIARDGVFGLPYFATRIFHNKPVYYAFNFLDNYFSHFSYQFLFTDKIFPERYVVPNHGILYIFMLPLILYGAYAVLVKDRKVGLFLILWILFSPIGSSLTMDDTQNIQRTLFATPSYAILSAYGFLEMLNILKKRYRALFLAFSMTTITFSFLYFLVQYFSQSSFYKPWIRQDGYKELVLTLEKNLSNYKKVVVTNRESAPTLFLFFYKKYSPDLAQKAVSSSPLKDTDRISFDQYEITEEECPLRIEINKDTGEKILIGEKNVMYVNSGLCKEESAPANSSLIKTIYRRDGSKAFQILEIY